MPNEFVPIGYDRWIRYSGSVLAIEKKTIICEHDQRDASGDGAKVNIRVNPRVGHG
jgi:hypothetical protein